MKAVIATSLGLMSVFFAASAQELSDGGPAHLKLEFENDAVRVLRILIGPHERIPMHDVSPRVVIWLTDVHLRDTFPDGKTRQEDRQAGEITWVSREKHAGENLSDKPIEFIAVVLKAAEPSFGTKETQGEAKRTRPH